MKTHLRASALRALATLCLLALTAVPASAQTLQYPDPSLDAVFPAGGQRGQVVDVELLGFDGLTGATGVFVDGPPGITVSDVKGVNYNRVTARFTIAPDAPLGRRLVRVMGGLTGLTSYRSFFVGQIPELLEQEPPSGTVAEPQTVVTPVVINGKLDPTLDVDEFRFQGRAGEPIVAAILAHRMDTLYKRSKSPGFLDTNLELLDANGRIIAADEDTLGLDPLIHCTLPADGLYTVRVRSLSFHGFPQAVYRLTLGNIPYPTSIFPAGGRRGAEVEVEFAGPNVAPGTKRKIAIPADGRFPLEDVSLAGAAEGIQYLTFQRGDAAEIAETEPNDQRTAATPLSFPVTVNARIGAAGDEDWYRLTLAAKQGVLLQTVAQRHLGSPVDTSLEVYDAMGRLVLENDDGRPFGNECLHDFESFDSWLQFTPATPGDYFVRVRDQGNAAGARAIYRLMVTLLEPDYELYQWPDAVPIWGPGTTATFVVQQLSWAVMDAPIELRVEGLPTGWKSSVSSIPPATFTPYGGSNYGIKALVAITAPADAPIGTLAPFRVFGKAVLGGRTIEHEAQPLTLLGNSHNDRMHLRFSPQARAVIAPPLDSSLETTVSELTVEQGQRVEIPVAFRRDPKSKVQMSVTLDGQTVAASTAWQPPFPLAADQSQVLLPVTVGADRPPGTYGVVISRSWASDLRAGRPGPCTTMIKLHVVAPGKKVAKP